MVFLTSCAPHALAQTVPPPLPPNQVAEADFDPQSDLRRFQGTSSWLVSAVIHMAGVLCLALIAMPLGTRMFNPLILTSQPGDDTSISEFTLAQEPPTGIEQTEENTEATVEVPDALSLVHDMSLIDPTVATSVDAIVTETPLPDLAESTGGDRGENTDDAMFFGTSASGRRFIFILDCSGSMQARDGGRFERARDELVASLSRLRPEQEFYVYLFNWSTFPMFGQLADPGKPIPATPDNVAKLRNWLYAIQPDSGTDPRRALRGAHEMKPDAIFLLSDGKFNTPSQLDLLQGWDPSDTSVFTVVSQLEPLRCQINTIAFEDMTAAQGMAKLAAMTEGQFRFVPAPGQRDFTGEAPIAAAEGPDYQPKTKEERIKMGQDILLLRRAEKLVERDRIEHARRLVKDLDPATLPRDARARLQAILN